MPAEKRPRKATVRRDKNGRPIQVSATEAVVHTSGDEPDRRRSAAQRTARAAQAGNPITVVCAEASAVHKFINLINRLPVDLRDALVLVGGLAVTCRLQFAYRVTDDIDSVYFNDDDGDLARVLAERFDTTLDGHRVDLGDGVHLDIIETGAFDPTQLPDDPVDRTFIEGHRWAYDTATSERIIAMHANGNVHAATEMRIARPSALVVMKLGTLDEPYKRSDAKKASDAADAYHLLDALDADGHVASQIRSAPGDIADLTAVALRRHFIDDVTITARRIRSNVNLDRPITDDDLRRVATRCLHTIT